MNSTKESRKTRREQAHERQFKYDRLSLDQKIEKARSRRGGSAKEITRLETFKQEEEIEKAK